MFDQFGIVYVQLDVGVEHFCDFAQFQRVNGFYQFRVACLIQGCDYGLDGCFIGVVVVTLIENLEEGDKLVFGEVVDFRDYGLRKGQKTLLIVAFLLLHSQQHFNVIMLVSVWA